eukprot:GHVH01016470.1.p1 GENE.GHVH01016470.1~~GHVH01016470.1.p1  ORF type:complete len:222 (+),score=15.05 GHVH01016470.1:74-667(+)
MGQIFAHTCGDSTTYYEHPDYEVVRVFNGFELRLYNRSVWTTASVVPGPQESDREVSSRSFHMLFDYIRGKNNADHKAISMTVPVVMKETDPSNEYKMSFFLPRAQSEMPPAPTDQHVATETWEPFEVYVRVFHPWTHSIKGYLDNRDTLLSLMAEKGLKVESGYQWYRAGYDAPFKLCNRRSEVWIPKNQVVQADE